MQNPPFAALAPVEGGFAFAAALAGGYGDNPVYAQTTIDYDDDDDGLINVRSLAQLDAVRRDLDGNGDPSSGGATACGAAFPKIPLPPPPPFANILTNKTAGGPPCPIF